MGRVTDSWSFFLCSSTLMVLQKVSGLKHQATDAAWMLCFQDFLLWVSGKQPLHYFCLCIIPIGLKCPPDHTRGSMRLAWESLFGLQTFGYLTSNLCFFLVWMELGPCYYNTAVICLKVRGFHLSQTNMCYDWKIWHFTSRLKRYAMEAHNSNLTPRRNR